LVADYDGYAVGRKREIPLAARAVTLLREWKK
jgi:hypothetical protein